MNERQKWQKEAESCGIFLYSWSTVFTQYLKELHRTPTHLSKHEAISGMITWKLQPACCQPLTKENEQKKCPAVQTGTTFLQTETNTFAKDNFR